MDKIVYRCLSLTDFHFDLLDASKQQEAFPATIHL